MDIPALVYEARPVRFVVWNCTTDFTCVSGVACVAHKPGAFWHALWHVAKCQRSCDARSNNAVISHSLHEREHRCAGTQPSICMTWHQTAHGRTPRGRAGCTMWRPATCDHARQVLLPVDSASCSVAIMWRCPDGETPALPCNCRERTMCVSVGIVGTAASSISQRHSGPEHGAAVLEDVQSPGAEVCICMPTDSNSDQ